MKKEEAIKIHRIVNEIEKIDQMLIANDISGISIINDAHDTDYTDIENIAKEALKKRKEELEKQIENYE